MNGRGRNLYHGRPRIPICRALDQALHEVRYVGGGRAEIDRIAVRIIGIRRPGNFQRIDLGAGHGNGD